MGNLIAVVKKVVGIERKEISNIEVSTYVPSEKVVYMLTHFSNPLKRMNGCPIVEKLEEVEHMKSYIEMMGIRGTKIVEITECEIVV